MAQVTPQKQRFFNKQLLRQLLFLIGMGFIGLLIYHSWTQLQQLLQQLNILIFSASILVFWLGNLCSSFLFYQLLEKHQLNIPFKDSFQLFFYSQFAKYIPGKIWLLFYQASFFKQKQSIAKLFFVNLDLMLLLLWIVFIIAICLLVIQQHLIIAITIFILGGFISIYSISNCKLFNYLNQWIKKIKYSSKDNTYHCQNCIKTWQIGLFYSLFSASYIFAHFMMLAAVFDFTVIESINYIAYMGIAWLVGVLAILVPGGIGLREFVFIALAQWLTQDISLEILTAIAVISRFWAILQEIMATLFAFIFTKFILK